MYLLCHIYPGVPHQCAALFSLGLLHYMHDKTNINQHTFSYNTVTTLTTWYNTVTTLTTWYIHHYMHNVNYVWSIWIILDDVYADLCRGAGSVYGLSGVTCRCLVYEFATKTNVNMPDNWARDGKAGVEWMSSQLMMSS